MHTSPVWVGGTKYHDKTIMSRRTNLNELAGFIASSNELSRKTFSFPLWTPERYTNSENLIFLTRGPLPKDPFPLVRKPKFSDLLPLWWCP